MMLLFMHKIYYSRLG